jgi:hypothetical protein
MSKASQSCSAASTIVASMIRSRGDAERASAGNDGAAEAFTPAALRPRPFNGRSKSARPGSAHDDLAWRNRKSRLSFKFLT